MRINVIIVKNICKLIINCRNKFDQLYEISKNGKKKADRKKEDIEYEQQQDELTFVPRILRQNASAKKLNKNDKKVQYKLIIRVIQIIRILKRVLLKRFIL